MTNALVPQRGIPEAVEQAVAQLIASRRAANTRKAYASDWGRWAAFARQRGADLGQPSLPLAVAFRGHLEQEGLGPASIARVLASLSFIHRALQSQGVVPVNPFDRAWLPRPEIPEEAHTREIPDAHAEAMIEAARADTSPAGARDYAMLRILRDTGMRRSSLASLKVADLSVGSDGVPRARIWLKGGKERQVALTKEAAAAIHRWFLRAPAAPSGGWVFPSDRDPGKPIHLSRINLIVKTRAREAGAGHAHPHQFRASFATDAYDAKLYERDIQGALHHADPATTRRYDRGARGGGVAETVSKFRKERSAKR